MAALEGTLALIAHRPAKTWSDADVDKFPDLVAPIGQALREFRQQHENLKSSNERDLSAQDQQAVKQLVKRLSKNLAAKDGTPVSPQIVKAALEELLKNV